MLQNMWTVFIENKQLLLDLLWEHLEISLFAIVIAILVGGTVGILISEFQKSAKPTLGTINFLYTIPSISMLGFLIPFSGIGNVTAVIALTIYALLPMVRNTYTGIKNVDAAILEAAKGMGSTRTQILFKIKLPLAMPVILSGIRNMVTMIGSLLIAALAIVMDVILGFVEKRINKRSVKEKKQNRVMAVAAILVCICIAVTSILPAGGKDTIQIATKPMTEQYIIGEMLDILIEQDTDLEVELTQGVGGGTSNIQPAMESGEFDIYPEYTGTAWNMVLKKEGLYTEKLFQSMEDEYKEELDMQWIGMYGFSNNYGLLVRKEIAEKYNLKTYSDLRAIDDELVFGAEYDFFEREDGYKALCETYGLNFKETMDMDIGLKYQAINEGKIDVMTVFTTDGQLSVSDVTMLEDDKGFFPSYKCGNIIRLEVLEKHPELNEVFKKLTDAISDGDMAQMNYAVESEGMEPREVAKEFLQDKGLMK